MSATRWTIRGWALGAVGLAAAASPALGQVKSAFPGPRREDSPTPLQRSLPPQAPQAGVPTRSIPVTGVVGRGVVVSPGTVVSDSGLTVSGAFRDDNFQLRFRLGSPEVRFTRVILPGGTVFCSPNWYYGGYGYPRYFNGYYDNSDQRYAVIDGGLVQSVPVYIPVPAEPAHAEAPPPPTDAEMGAALLKAGDAEGAVAKFREHLRGKSEDAAAMRGLAVALIEAGQIDQGVAVMGMAYRTEPGLADLALPAATLYRRDADLRATLRKSVVFANKMKTASSWLTVAVLMQAEGRKDHALRMVERAAELGLEDEVVKRLRVALGG